MHLSPSRAVVADKIQYDAYHAWRDISEDANIMVEFYLDLEALQNLSVGILHNIDQIKLQIEKTSAMRCSFFMTFLGRGSGGGARTAPLRGIISVRNAASMNVSMGTDSLFA